MAGNVHGSTGTDVTDHETPRSNGRGSRSLRSASHLQRQAGQSLQVRRDRRLVGQDLRRCPLHVTRPTEAGGRTPRRAAVGKARRTMLNPRLALSIVLTWGPDRRCSHGPEAVRTHALSRLSQCQRSSELAVPRPSLARLVTRCPFPRRRPWPPERNHPPVDTSQSRAAPPSPADAPGPSAPGRARGVAARQPSPTRNRRGAVAPSSARGSSADPLDVFSER